MKKASCSATGMFLIVGLMVSLAPTPASAHGPNDEQPIRLYATAHFGPIGIVRWATLGGDAATIDGRPAHGAEPVWGGELVQAPAGRGVQVSFDSMGSVTLGANAAARFGVGRAASGGVSYPVLVASLERGSMNVRLEGAGGYVEGGGSTFVASRDASFSVRMVDGLASVNTSAGIVRVQDQTPPQDVNIRVVDELGRPVASGSQLSVRARSTRQVQVQVTDKNDKPLPDLPVLFSLGDPCLGSLGLGAVAGLTLAQKTDKRGIAAVPLVAGAARCAASIIAKVEGTNASVSIQTSVVPKQGFWSARNTLLVAAAAAGAGIAIGLVVANSGSEPIRAVPPTVVKP